MSKTPDWKLECFDWLPLSRWTVPYIISDGEESGKQYCKICDKWVPVGDTESHVQGHVKEMKALRKRRAKENAERKREAAALARQAKKEKAR